MTDQHLLETYLNDHLATSTALVELARRTAGQHEGDRGVELQRLAGELAEDQEALRGLMKRLGAEESTLKTAAGWVAEKLGRLKPSGHVVTRSPLSDVEEVEGLRVGTTAQVCMLQVLRAVAVHDGRVSREELETLLERAEDRGERLYRVHVQLAQENLAG